MVNLKRLTKKKKIQEIDDDDDKHELESKHKSNPNQLESNFTNSRVIPASLLLTDGWKGGIHSDASLLAETPQVDSFKKTETVFDHLRGLKTTKPGTSTTMMVCQELNNSTHQDLFSPIFNADHSKNANRSVPPSVQTFASRLPTVTPLKHSVQSAPGSVIDPDLTNLFQKPKKRSQNNSFKIPEKKVKHNDTITKDTPLKDVSIAGLDTPAQISPLGTNQITPIATLRNYNRFIKTHKSLPKTPVLKKGNSSVLSDTCLPSIQSRTKPKQLDPILGRPLNTSDESIGFQEPKLWTLIQTSITSAPPTPILNRINKTPTTPVLEKEDNDVPPFQLDTSAPQTPIINETMSCTPLLLQDPSLRPESSSLPPMFDSEPPWMEDDKEVLEIQSIPFDNDDQDVGANIVLNQEGDDGEEDGDFSQTQTLSCGVDIAPIAVVQPLGLDSLRDVVVVQPVLDYGNDQSGEMEKISKTSSLIGDSLESSKRSGDSKTSSLDQSRTKQDPVDQEDTTEEKEFGIDAGEEEMHLKSPLSFPVTNPIFVERQCIDDTPQLEKQDQHYVSSPPFLESSQLFNEDALCLVDNGKDEDQEQVNNVPLPCIPAPVESSQMYNDPLFSTQLLANMGLPDFEMNSSKSKEVMNQIDESQNEYMDPFLSTQICKAIPLSPFAKQDDVIPKQGDGAVPPGSPFVPGSVFGTARGRVIPIQKESLAIASIFIAEQSSDYQGDMKGTAYLRKKGKVDGASGIVSTLADVESMVRLRKPELVSTQQDGLDLDDAEELLIDFEESENCLDLVDREKENVNTEFVGFQSAKNVIAEKENPVSEFQGFSKASGAGWSKTSEFKSPLTLLHDNAIHGITFDDSKESIDDLFVGFTTASKKSLPQPRRETFGGFSNASRPFQSPFANNPTKPSTTPIVTRSGFSSDSKPFKTPLIQNQSISNATTTTTTTSTVFGDIKNTPFKKPTIVPYTKRANLHSIVLKPSDGSAQPVQSISNPPKATRLTRIPANRQSYSDLSITTQVTLGPWCKVNGSNAIDVTFDEGQQQLGWSDARSKLIECGCLSSTCTRSWVMNHYRWIVWKLASLAARCGRDADWTFDNVVTQLKFRYDVECFDIQRSAIKLIVEGDDTPAKHMVLFVSDLLDDGHEIEMKLSDGWYSIKCQLDEALKRLIRSGKIFIGQKLHIQGAQLMGGSDGCPVLEMSPSISLKISANSTRRARWDTMLGYQNTKSYFSIHLKSIIPDGGQVACIDVIIMRKYPLQFTEKRSNGGQVSRNAQEEEHACREWDKMFDDALRKAEKLYESDPSQFDVDSTDREGLHRAFKEYAMDQVPLRDVKPCIVLKICDYPILDEKCLALQTEGFITVYAQSEESLMQFKEGSRFKFFNTLSNNIWKNGQIHLRSFPGRSHSRLYECNPECLEKSLHVPRNLVSLFDHLEPSTEIDTCLILLDSFFVGRYLTGASESSYQYKYRLLCTCESSEMIVIELSSWTDRMNLFTPKSIFLFMNLSFTYRKQHFIKCTLSPKTGIFSKTLLAPFNQSSRFAELRAHVQSWTSLPEFDSTLLASL